MMVCKDRNGFALSDDWGYLLERGFPSEKAARRYMLDIYDHRHDCVSFDVGGCDDCARERREEDEPLACRDCFEPCTFPEMPCSCCGACLYNAKQKEREAERLDNADQKMDERSGN